MTRVLGRLLSLEMAVLGMCELALSFLVIYGMLTMPGVLPAMAEASGVGAKHVAALDTGARYDFVLVPPHEEDTGTINQLVRDGIANHFHVSIASETRSMDAYVITAIQGKTPRPKPEDEAMGGSFGMLHAFAPRPPSSISPAGSKIGHARSSTGCR